MLNLIINRCRLTFLIFFTLCTILRPSTCFIISKNGFIITTPYTHRSPCKINTLIQSRSDDLSNEDNQTHSNDSQDANNSTNLELNNQDNSDTLDSTPVSDSTNSEQNRNNLDFDKFEFNPKNYKKIIESFTLFKGPSYSLREYNDPLPEGCRTIVDFLEFPRNYDFSRAAEILSEGQIGGQGSTLVEDSVEGQEKRMEGPYLKSGYETVGNLAESINVRYTTRDEDEEVDVKPEQMYSILKGEKGFKDLKRQTMGSCKPFEEFSDLESDSDDESIDLNYSEDSDTIDTEDGSQLDLADSGNEVNKEASKGRVRRKDYVPLSRINPNCFMYDTYGYLQYYLKYINDFKYDLFSYHHKEDDSLSYYLNYEYIKKIERPFPPQRDHTEKMREYFLSLLPTLMDRLVESIKNDPNKKNTPSPPMHDLSLLFNFRPPKYLFEDEDEDAEVERDRKYYEKYASLKGLHDPANNLVYPYHNFEPVLLRQLLSIYLDMHTTRDLGELPAYKKYKSKSKYLKTMSFPSHTRPPQPLESISGANDSDTDDTNSSKELNDYNSDKPENIENRDVYVSGDDYLKKLDNFPTYEVRTKVYERGKKKRGRACVYLEPGNGNVIINNRDGYQYVFYNEYRLREILEPLSSLRLNKHFNIVAKAAGGGISGQSVAIRHALVKYLYKILSPKLKPILRRFDLVSIDRRRVERKKTNLRKARKKEMYSKR